MAASAMKAVALRSAPFMCFSKRAPTTLPHYDVDTDFQYFFFNSVMAQWSGLTPAFLTNGRNAKTDFPIDFEAYFRDDAAVCTEFIHPLVKKIIEPWQPPHMSTVLHTRKTAMRDSRGHAFMLGCVAPIDDIELGITTFSARSLAPPQPALAHIHDAWYESAWAQLPQGACLVNASTGVLSDVNSLGVATGPALDDMAGRVLARVRDAPDAECWGFGGVDGLLSDSHARVWVWKLRGDLPGDEEHLALSFRPSASVTDLRNTLSSADAVERPIFK